MDKTQAIEIPDEAPYEQSGPYEQGEAAYARPAPETVHATPEIIRPTGISWVTLTLGLLCLGLAAFVLTWQLADVDIDWSTAAPIFVVGAGALLVIAGIGSMLTRGRQDD